MRHNDNCLAATGAQHTCRCMQLQLQVPPNCRGPTPHLPLLLQLLGLAPHFLIIQLLLQPGQLCLDLSPLALPLLLLQAGRPKRRTRDTHDNMQGSPLRGCMPLLLNKRCTAVCRPAASQAARPALDTRATAVKQPPKVHQYDCVTWPPPA
jgi:hypothetical protein